MTDEELFQRFYEIDKKHLKDETDFDASYPPYGPREPRGNQALFDTNIAYFRARCELPLDESAEAIDAKVEAYRSHLDADPLGVSDYDMMRMNMMMRMSLSYSAANLQIWLEYYSTKSGTLNQLAYERKKRRLEILARAGIRVFMVDYQPLYP